MFKPYHQNDNDDSPKADPSEVNGMFDILDAAGEHKVEPAAPAQPAAGAAGAAQPAGEQIDFDAALKQADIKPLDMAGAKPAGVETVDFSAVGKPVTVAQAVANTTTAVVGNSAAAAQPAAVAAAAVANGAPMASAAAPVALGAPAAPVAAQPVAPVTAAQPGAPAQPALAQPVAAQPVVAQPIAQTENFAFPAPVATSASATVQTDVSDLPPVIPQPAANQPAVAQPVAEAAANEAPAAAVKFDQTEKPMANVLTPAASEPIAFDAAEKPVNEVAPELAKPAEPVVEAKAEKPAAETIDFTAAEKPAEGAAAAPAEVAPVAPAVDAPAAAPAAASAEAETKADAAKADVAEAAAEVKDEAKAEAKAADVQTEPASQPAPVAAAAPAVPVAPAVPAASAAKPAAAVAASMPPVKVAPAAKQSTVKQAAAKPVVAPAAASATKTAPTPAAAPAPAGNAAPAAVVAKTPAPAVGNGGGKDGGKGKKGKKKSDDESFGRSGMLSKVRHGTAWTVFFAILSLLWIYPIVLVFINSFKKKQFITGSATFELPNDANWAGLDNYYRGVEQTNLFASFGWTVFITVGAVALILVCTSMCAWWIVRVNNLFAKIIYMLFLFNMIVPFQMVMYPLSKIANMMGLDTPWGLWIIYLGFGAGLSVFMFTGVIKGLPAEIEESAMIDGASVPQTFFGIVWPMMKPSMVSVAILQTMWIWNDYLLPYLILDMKKYKTMSIAVQYLKGGFGSIDMGAMMGCLVLAMLPIIIFYLVCQKYIIAGVTAGAVKG